MPFRWSRGLIAALFVIACSLSCIEFVLNMLASRSTARATTITMHTMLALIVIPSMFRAHDLSKRSPAQPPISFAHDDARSIFAEKGGRSGVIAAKRRTQSDFRLARDGPHRPRVLSAGDAKRQSGDSSDTGDEREEQQPEDWGDTKIILANMWNTASENLNSAAAASLLFGSSTYRWARRMRSRMPNSDRDADADSLSSDDDYEAAEEARVSVNVGSSNSIVDLGHFFLGMSLVQVFIPSLSTGSGYTLFAGICMTCFFAAVTVVVIRDDKKRLSIQFLIPSFLYHHQQSA